MFGIKLSNVPIKNEQKWGGRLTFLVIVNFIALAIVLFFSIAGYNLLGDYERLVPEMQHYESLNLLQNLPRDASPLLKLEVKLVHDSRGLQKYIEEIKSDLKLLEAIFCGLLGSFIITLALRIWLGAKNRIKGKKA